MNIKKYKLWVWLYANSFCSTEIEAHLMLQLHTLLVHTLHMPGVFHKARQTYCRHIANVRELVDSCKY